MAQALPQSRESIRALWLQGLTHNEIFARSGVKPATLRAWIARLGWKRDGVKLAPTEQAPVSKDVADRLAKLTVTEAERILCKLRDTKLGTIRDCKDAAAAVASAYSSARRALGLDDDRGRSVTILASFQTVSGLGPASPAPAQIVDVEVVPEPGAPTAESSQPDPGTPA